MNDIKPQLVVLFVDLQEGIVEASRTQSSLDVRRGVKALAKITHALGLPHFASVVPMGPESVPPLLAEIVHELPLIKPHLRKTFSAMMDDTLTGFLAETGARRIAIAGVLTEVAVLRTALDAQRLGFEVELIIDACAGMSTRTEQAALAQVSGAGGIVTSVASFASALCPDLSSPAASSVLAALRGLLH